MLNESIIHDMGEEFSVQWLVTRVVVSNISAEGVKVVIHRSKDCVELCKYALVRARLKRVGLVDVSKGWKHVEEVMIACSGVK